MTRETYILPRSGRNMLLAVVLTVGLWALPWLLWTTPGPRAPVRRAHPRPTIRFVRPAPAPDGGVWSAVIIPLPNKLGFSGAVGLKGPGQDLAGVMKRRADEPPYLAPAPAPEPVRAGALALNLDRTSYVPEAVEPPAYMLVHSNLVEGYRAEWSEGLRARRFQAPALAQATGPEGGAAWVAMSAWVGLDARGRTAHVFVEQSSGQTNVDAAVIRALRMGQAEPGAGPVAGRVRVWYAPGESGTSVRRVE
jgi:hypothetical protein